MIMSTDAGKKNWQNSTSFYNKPLNKLGIEGTCPDIKTVYEKPI